MDNNKNPANALNYNCYSYVLNNPLKYNDPTGYNAASTPYPGEETVVYYQSPARYDFSAAYARIDQMAGSGGYYYDWTTGTYHENYSGAEVSFSTGYNNYALPNSITLKPIQIQRNSIIPELNPNSLTASADGMIGLDNIDNCDIPSLDISKKILFRKFLNWPLL